MSDNTAPPPPEPEGTEPPESSALQPSSEQPSALAPEPPPPSALAPEPQPPVESAAPPPPPPPPADAVPPAGAMPPPPPPAGANPPPGSYPPPPAGGYPPPPPGAYPPPGGYYQGMPAGGPVRVFSVGDALGYGWKGFTANLGPVLVIMAIVVVINLVFNVLQWATRDSGFVVSTSLSLLSAFVSLLVGLGLIRAALIILDGRRPEIADLLSTDGIGAYIVASILASVIVFVGLLLCVIPGLIAAFLLQFYGYAIVDRRTDSTTVVANADPVGAMKASYEIVSKNVGQLILLALVFVGILVLMAIGLAMCVLPGLVVMVVAMPVMAIAVAYAWRFFTGGVISALA